MNRSIHARSFRNPLRYAECGVALVIVLILLAILTLLALAGAATATAELTMAGHEQYRTLASEAASNGIELGIARIRTLPAPIASPVVLASALGSATLRYAGDELALPQSSVEKLVGHHYVIDSTGRSERGAVEMQTQGALSIEAAVATQTYGRLGSGLGTAP